MFVVVFRSSLRGLCRPFGPSEGEEGGSFLTMILGLPLLRPLVWSAQEASVFRDTYDKGDFFPPGGLVFSFGVALVISTEPFEVANLSEGVLTAAGARGAYDRGLGCRSWTDIGAGLGTATAVDIVVVLPSSRLECCCCRVDSRTLDFLPPLPCTGGGLNSAVPPKANIVRW